MMMIIDIDDNLSNLVFDHLGMTLPSGRIVIIKSLSIYL